MERGNIRLSFLCVFLYMMPVNAQQQYITLGIPTSLNLLEGKEANLAAWLAIEEINAKGGVKVGNEKRLLRVESLDIRDGEPGVPVSKRCSASKNSSSTKRSMHRLWEISGLKRCLPPWTFIQKYKVINIATIAMVPKFESLVAEKSREIQIFLQNVSPIP